MKCQVFFLCVCIGVINAGLKEQFALVLQNTGTTEDRLAPVLNFSTRCLPPYGCYYNGPPFFDPLMRPISLLPAENPQGRIKFLLYTPKNRGYADNYTLEMTRDSLQHSYYNASLPTMLWYHGWQLTLNDSDALFGVMDALMDYENGYNFFAIDWSRYTGRSYEEALANGRVVGSAGAQLIKFLTSETNTTANSFHVIGHSLGGQLIAYTGQETPGLGRITALDASGPYYYNSHPDVRLDPSDALFVDVIHANGGYDPFDGLGMMAPYGHQDFYPNGGQRQPGCGHEDPKIEEAIKTDIIQMYLVQCCDHGRSVDYFLQSITNENCHFKGTRCKDYNDWKKGNCPPSKHPVAIMGIKAKLRPKIPPLSKFYFDTATSAPHCKLDGHIHPNLATIDL